jgi:hypothetical protein
LREPPPTPAPGEDHDVPEPVDPLDAEAAERGHPEEPAQVPARRREVGVLEPPARFVDEHVVALLGEPQGSDGTAEAGTDDDDVVIGPDAVRHGHGRCAARAPASIPVKTAANRCGPCA